MVNPQQPLPAGGRTREAAALMEIAHTQVSPATARFLLAFFLAAIAIVPAIDIGLARAQEDRGIGLAWSRLSSALREVRPRVATNWQRIVAGNHALLNGLTAFERALEDESLMARSLRPAAQLAMTAWLGAGNEQVYPGRNGWLFYRPDVEYLTGRPFLDPSQIRRRIKETPAWGELPQPDPYRALVQFKADLDKRGIALLVMPTPHKPALHPEQLTGRRRPAFDALENPSFAELVLRLEEAGILVFNPADTLRSLGAGTPKYLTTDTHWRPEAMEAVASSLARFIAARVKLNDVANPGHRIERVEVRNAGDTTRMLDLPEDSAAFTAETVWLRRVLRPDGTTWRSTPASDVLVLGDSFANIYSLESMQWGTSAGFVEQLSDAMRRPIDRLTQNDQGAFATRQMLVRNPDRLAGKRLVVYQFASRELAFGDWQVLPLR
jgi:alginate O-acetyltransferase complex protein AlgJ